MVIARNRIGQLCCHVPKSQLAIGPRSAKVSDFYNDDFTSTLLYVPKVCVILSRHNSFFDI